MMRLAVAATRSRLAAAWPPVERSPTAAARARLSVARGQDAPRVIECSPDGGLKVGDGEPLVGQLDVGGCGLDVAVQALLLLDGRGAWSVAVA